MNKAGLIEKCISYEKAEECVKKFLPNEINTPWHHLMRIMDDQETPGSIWFELRDRGVRVAYLLGITVNENYRQRGCGMSAMRILEQFIKKGNEQ
jgi:ribosomal protein S18 acetylase RimI-like enzyme